MRGELTIVATLLLQAKVAQYGMPSPIAIREAFDCAEKIINEGENRHEAEMKAREAERAAAGAQKP